ncbi:Polymerase/histidinol phosphatase-like protein [Gamsiella multidivaricata]|uniref:Polymerase/histidinol phosphatase-like protein n=1 Tax=Gamsiella multidivaricata TaxID=101098 RepID=UPI00221FE3C0|nr:Polymerase/histidinol phosphatase-like protein [Gamsiella multidivaricata]KAG0371307.1 histidinolphosphatase [Gamsiella multidivaricata]KAI7816608.1 Polymerase/histidinol phosphatase-like protein [Gamsiella multidivaricata]
MFSFHSHSGQFCMHAKGTLEQVVQSAIERRFTTYGLSEHMPRYSPDQLYPEESHLTTQDLERKYDQFLQEAIRLQQKYSDKICLLIGLETEYFDSKSIDLVRNLRQPNRQSRFLTTETVEGISILPQVQYIVGSLHHVRGVPLDFSQELYLKALEDVGQGSWEKLFEMYFDSQFEMLQGLEPEVVGHLDLVRIFFSAIKGHYHHHHHHQEDGNEQEQEQEDPTVSSQNRLTDNLWRLVKRNVDFVIAYGGLFELNSRAWKKGLADAYPQRDILEYILSKQGRVTLSDDSHGPDDVGMFYDPELKGYLEQMKIEQVYYLAPNSSELNRPYTTNASAGTGSFQHVHVRSIPLADLHFYEKQ